MPFISDKRAAAARANGARSRGPKTPEGKARSAINALKHGLTARTVDALTPDPDVVRAALETYRSEYQPSGPVEEALIALVAETRCRLNRLFELDRQLFSKPMHIRQGIGLAERLHRREGPLQRTLKRLALQLDRLYKVRISSNRNTHGRAAGRPRK